MGEISIIDILFNNSDFIKGLYTEIDHTESKRSDFGRLDNDVIR
jgi:hypothetical protein